MNENTLVEKVNALPEDLKSEVLHYIDSLLENQKKNQVKKTPKPGSGKHIFKRVAPDFDAPLDDFKEYM